MSISSVTHPAPAPRKPTKTRPAPSRLRSGAPRSGCAPHTRHRIAAVTTETHGSLRIHSRLVVLTSLLRHSYVTLTSPRPLLPGTSRSSSKAQTHVPFPARTFIRDGAVLYWGLGAAGTGHRWCAPYPRCTRAGAAGVRQHVFVARTPPARSRPAGRLRGRTRRRARHRCPLRPPNRLDPHSSPASFIAVAARS